MLVLILLCSVCFPEVVRAESITYFVTNEINKSAVVCNGYHSCHTLNELAVNASLLFLEYANYSLVLEDGTHELTFGLVVSGIHQLELCSYHPLGSAINITYGNVTLYNMSSLSINRLGIIASTLQKEPNFLISEIKVVKFDDVKIANVSISALRKLGPRKLNSVFVIGNASVENSALRFQLKNCLLLLLDSYLDGSVLVETNLVVGIFSKQKMVRIRIVGCRISGRISFRVRADSDILLSIVDISDTIISDTSYEVGGSLRVGCPINMYIDSRVQLNITESNISSLCAEVSEESALFAYFSKCFHHSYMDMYSIGIKQMKFSQLLLDVRDSVFEQYLNGVNINIHAIAQQHTSFYSWSSTIYIFQWIYSLCIPFQCYNQ